LTGIYTLRYPFAILQNREAAGISRVTCFGILSDVMESPRIHLGTSSFTAAGWSGSFYPKGLKHSEYLPFYSEHFSTVEIDSTFYACPSPSTVKGWAQKTPDDFIFSVKVPQTITHEKVLVDCDGEFEQFVQTMSILESKLGAMVLQFPYFSSDLFQTLVQFLSRLKAFLKKMPSGYKLAVEIRNKSWLNDRLADVLREYKVALVLLDRELMPMPNELAESFDPITTNWTYIRWLGDRKGVEQITTTWDKAVVDRTDKLSSWVDYCQQVQRRGVTIFAYANNHFGGHAPATVRQFRELWSAKGLPALPEPPRRIQQGTSLSLFDEPV
jgi:uncharacterized protein YecE (DUF72 family)